MKKLFTLFLALVMCFSLVACGGPDKQPAIDAFNSANTAFTEIANAINADIEAYPEEIVDVMIEMANLMGEYKGLLEGDQEFTEEQLNEMIAWFESVEEWVAQAKAEFEL